VSGPFPISHTSLTASRSFGEVYRQLLWELLSPAALEEVNERTGARISVLPNPVHFNLDLRAGYLPLCGVRRTFPRTAAAEVAWFLLGSKDVSFIREYAPIWDKFVEEDGTTVAGAYGHRWREHFGRDQVSKAIEALRANPTDRRVVVMAWDPGHDGLGEPSKNVPCPLGFTLSVVAGRLNSAIVLRSSDVFVGLPYDVMGHALLMQAIAASIGGLKGLGTMSVTLAHPHLYGVHEGMAAEALRTKDPQDTRLLPPWSVEQIEDDPHGYVFNVKLLFSGVRQPDFHCRPEVVA
jgi:thymidylate synthase